MKRLLTASLLVFFISACAHTPQKLIVPDTSLTQREGKIANFSDNPAGSLPRGWEPLIIHKTKKQTEYQLISEEGISVLHARAAKASSGLLQHVSIEPGERPWVDWKWKVSRLIASANNADREVEDSPARIILGFDGDKDNLPFADQIMFETARVVTGHEFPYATLMYIWENKLPVGTVIPSSRSGRVKMMVAASGADGVGKWRSFSRNIIDDYEKAFGEKPGKLIGVGVLTDTDNTGETVEAWYGDIKVQREKN